MKGKTSLKQGILGYVQTPKGSIAVRVMNDVFVTICSRRGKTGKYSVAS